LTIHELQRVHRAQPFRPFTLSLADGRSVKIPHPEFLWVPPIAQRTFMVADAEGDIETIDLLLVTSLKTGNSRSKRRRGRQNGR
jgi:hypothetical protein